MQSLRTLAVACGVAIACCVAGTPIAAAQSTPPAGPDANGVTVTNPGDPLAPVNLVVPFTVGQRGNSENFARMTGTITVSGAENFTSEVETSERSVGLDEVLAVNTDGSSELRYTTSLIEYSETYSNPEFTPSGYDLTVLQGVPLVISYGAGRGSTSVVADSAATPTADQQALLDDLSYSMPGFRFPTTPVGVGATWSAPETTFIEGIEVAGTGSFQLVAVAGDQYVITASASFDFSAIDPASYPDVVTGIGGSLTVTRSITGSLSTPMQYRQVETIRSITTTSYTDGTTWTFDLTTVSSFEETPA